MDADALKMYLQNIEEYVMDEDKIVTYKWLSKNFHIHVNTAKQLLYSFATEQKNNVHLTYLLGGTLRDGAGYKIQIVREDDLGKAKAEFKALSSEHVYSVQKAEAIPDLGVLYIVDSCKNDEKEDARSVGAITCGHSLLRPQEEIKRLRLNARASTSSTDGKQWSTCRTANKTAETHNKEVDTADVSKVENVTKKKELKKGGIAAMFAVQESKSKTQDGLDGKSKAPEKLTAKPKASSGINSFFSLQTEKPVSVANDSPDSGVNPQESESNDEVKTNCISKRDQEEQRDNLMSKRDQEKQREKLNKLKVVSNVKNSSTKGTESKVKRGKSKKLNTDEEILPSKRRKRIVVLSDSEDSSDEDIFDRDDGDAPDSPPLPQVALLQPESDADDIIPPTPEPELKKGRKRVRKMKDKTYMGEDGYMLTCKEYVFESCTDSEAEQEKENERKRSKESGEPTKAENSKSLKTASEKPPAKKKASPQKTKQATLMNFFKKNS